MSAMLNLLVIRAANLDRTRQFYEALGLQFTLEQHGSGPAHLAAELPGIVFEIYPLGTSPTSIGVRLGFQVPSLSVVIGALNALGSEVITPPTHGPWGLRAVVADPDGHRVEIRE